MLGSRETLPPEKKMFQTTDTPIRVFDLQGRTLIPEIPLEEMRRRYEAISFVGQYFDEGQSGPTHLRYLEKRREYAGLNPGDIGFWLIGQTGRADDVELFAIVHTLHPQRGDEDVSA